MPRPIDETVISSVLMLFLLPFACKTQPSARRNLGARPGQRQQDSMRSGPPQTTHPAPRPRRNPHIPPGWAVGNLDQTLATARATKRSILVFWNAKWCPPCNQVKLQVIQNPAFPSLVSGTLLLWMDGDGPGAQVSGQRLGLRGYPTLLLLDSNGRELMRMVGAVTFADFQALFRAATSVHEPIGELILKAVRNQAQSADWLLLSYHDWDQDARTHPDRTIRRLLRLVDMVPRHAKTASAMLAGRLLEIAARLSNKTPRTHGTSSSADRSILIQRVRRRAIELIDRLLAPAAGTGTAELLLYWNRTILSWIGCGSLKRTDILKRWSKRLERLGREQGLGEADRLWAAYAKLENAHLCDLPPTRNILETYKDLPDSAEVAAQAKRALASAEGSTQRHAIVSQAAEILARTEGAEAAERVLLAEAKRSDTPWYYWATLAWIYEKAHRPKMALQAGAKAASMARGRATGIQWQSAQVLRLLRLAPGDPGLASAVQSLVDLIEGEEGAWSGRNSDKIAQVSTALNELCDPLEGPSTQHSKKHLVLSDRVRNILARQARRLEQSCARHRAGPSCGHLVAALKKAAGPTCRRPQ